MNRATVLLLAALLAGAAAPAPAEVREVRIAQQYGISYLPVMIMTEKQLVQKHAKAAGLGDVAVVEATLSGSGAMNEGLLSGSIDIATGGTTGLITLWGKTRGTLQEVRGVAALTAMPLGVVTRNPAVKSLKDFTDADKIAVPSVKVSPQAIMLQMAAARLYGDADMTHFDRLTVSMAHPDAMAALATGSAGITAHVGAPPYQQQEAKMPGLRQVFSSYEVTGPKATLSVMWTTKRFRDANPKTYAAIAAAVAEAIDVLNRDKRAAAELYMRLAKEKGSMEDVLQILEDPENEFSPVPRGFMIWTEFMNRSGAIKATAASWKELFFENLHDQAGS